MSPVRFCANLSMMFLDCGESLLSRYASARQAGFRGVEAAFPYDMPAQDLARQKKDLGLEQVLLNAYPGDQLGFAALEGKEEDFMNSLSRSITYCRELNCKRLHIMSGKTDQTPGSADVLRKNLRSALPLLKENGIVGLIEPINHYSVPSYFLKDFELAASIVSEIDSPFLRLQMDIFHLQFLKGDLTNNIKKYLPMTGHIQIAQVPDRHEPDSAGEINYKYVLDVLEKSDYEGWIGLEYKPKAGTVDGLKWLQEYGYKL